MGKPHQPLFLLQIKNMKQNINFKIAIVIFTITISSCATIFSGTKDRIYFTTNVPGARVLIDGVEVCKTPCNENITRKIGESQIEFKLEGYETKVINLSKSFNVVSILNFGNLIGWGIDIATGAVFKYDKKAYDIELSKNNKVSKVMPDRIEINTKSHQVELYVNSK
jgi:hypothetical protein